MTAVVSTLLSLRLLAESQIFPKRCVVLGRDCHCYYSKNYYLEKRNIGDPLLNLLNCK